MPSTLSKSALIESITKLQTDGTSKRQVRSVIDALVTVGHRELKRSGVFVVPGFAKFVVVKKPATKERKGINPFTKEPTVFKEARAEGSKSPPNQGREGRHRITHVAQAGRSYSTIVCSGRKKCERCWESSLGA